MWHPPSHYPIPSHRMFYKFSLKETTDVPLPQLFHQRGVWVCTPNILDVMHWAVLHGRQVHFRLTARQEVGSKAPEAQLEDLGDEHVERVAVDPAGQHQQTFAKTALHSVPRSLVSREVSLHVAWTDASIRDFQGEYLTEQHGCSSIIRKSKGNIMFVGDQVSDKEINNRYYTWKCEWKHHLVLHGFFFLILCGKRVEYNETLIQSTKEMK